jgi:hypothetical protein
MSKDYILQVKVKNGPMLNCMRANGLETAADLSRLCGVGQFTIGTYLNLLAVPLSKTGGWKKSIAIIATALKVTPEILFPPQHIEKALATNKAEAEVSLQEIGVLTGEESHEKNLLEYMREEETHRRLEWGLHTISPRCAKVLRLRFGLDGEDPMTLAQVASRFSIGNERVRQLEASGLVKLRHATRMGRDERMAPLIARHKADQQELEALMND